MTRTHVNPIIKDSVTFLQTAAETGGNVTEVEVTLMPGGGNALHYHQSFSETFTPLEGPLGVKLGKNETKILQPGESYTVAKSEMHAFFNPSGNPVKFKVELHPAHEGFENSLMIGYGLAADGLTTKKAIPKSLKHVALLITMSDTNLPGFLTLLSPIFKRIAKKAKKDSTYQKLVEKYCL